MIGFFLFSLKNKGGGLRRTYEIKLNHFIEKGYKAYLLTYHVEDKLFFIQKNRNILQHIIDMKMVEDEDGIHSPIKKFFMFIKRTVQLVRAIKKYNIQIINISSYLGLPELMLASIITGVKYVLDLYETILWSNTDITKVSLLNRKKIKQLIKNTPGHMSPHNDIPKLVSQIGVFRKFIAEIRAFIYFIAIKRSELVICLSKKMAKEIIILYNKKPLVMPIIACDLPNLSPKENILCKKIKNLKKEGKKIILSVCVLNDFRKRVSMLIDAINYIKDKHRYILDKIVVVVVGDGPDKKKLEKMAEMKQLKDKYIIFTGFIDDSELSAIYRLADIFVHPAYADFDLTVVEALAFGLYIVTTEDTEIPIKIPEINQKFILTKVQHISFAEGILEAIERSQNQGNSNLIAIPTWKNFLSHYESIFQKILGISYS